MDIDAARKRAALPPTCFRCGQPGHIKSECPRRVDLRLLSSEYCEQLLEDLLAAKDVAESVEVPVASTSLEDDEDFYRREL